MPITAPATPAVYSVFKTASNSVGWIGLARHSKSYPSPTAFSNSRDVVAKPEQRRTRHSWYCALNRMASSILFICGINTSAINTSGQIV
jgi:hypothetical protein